jgi:hypothetical protein
MKVSSRKNSQLGDFRIAFRPKAITFSKPNTRSLKLYLEKSSPYFMQTSRSSALFPKRSRP